MLALRDGKQVNALPTGEELTSSAAPILVGDAVLVTTEHALLAFAPPQTLSQQDVLVVGRSNGVRFGFRIAGVTAPPKDTKNSRE